MYRAVSFIWRINNTLNREREVSLYPSLSFSLLMFDHFTHVLQYICTPPFVHIV